MNKMNRFQQVSGSLVILMAVGSARALQTPDPEPPIIDCFPQTDGQWAGPWSLEAEINPPGDFLWNEIAHCLVLPPPQQRQSRVPVPTQGQ